jgi:competence protein ComEA
LAPCDIKDISSMSAAPASPPVQPTPPQPVVLAAWPRSAQLATAFLLGVALTLLIVYSGIYLGWGSRPTERDRSTYVYHVDLNHASRAELLQLPGVGENMAGRIEEYRREHGGFRTVEDLVKVHGVGRAMLERLRGWVYVEEETEEDVRPVSASVRRASSGDRDMTVGVKQPAGRAPGPKEATLNGRIDINHASAEELQRLPGIGPKMSQRIVDERGKRPFGSVDELRRVSGIGPKTLEKLRPHVTVGRDPLRVATTDRS